MPRKPKRNAVARQWQLLSVIPGRPPGKSALELTHCLKDVGYEIKKRQVLRDLQELSSSFPLTTTMKGTADGWHWQAGASIQMPGLDIQGALALTMMGDVLRQLLPQSILRHLNPRIAQARKTLKELAKGNRAAEWANKVQAVPSHLPLIAPNLNEDTLDSVQTALLDNMQLNITYDALKGSGDRTIYPRGLIHRGPISYLIAEDASKPGEFRSFALHRIKKASQTTARCPAADFSLRDYIAKARDQFGPGDMIRLEAWVSPNLGRILGETRIAVDADLVTEKDGLILKATLPNTWALHTWILGQGEHIEVRKPASLRKLIRERVHGASRRYPT